MYSVITSFSFSFQGPASAYRPLQKAGEFIAKGAEKD
nr:MAG TPA: hypothetical protein [Caudoviricetes sp.]